MSTTIPISSSSNSNSKFISKRCWTSWLCSFMGLC